MAKESLLRSSIPQNLLTARDKALSSYFSSEPTAAFTALAARAHPKHNVVGVGIGRKLVNGKPSGVHCVRFYVERKLDKSVIPQEDLLPTEIGGVITDVIETGRFLAFVHKERQRIRPIQPGCSIGFEDKKGDAMAGTFGALVEKKGKRYILSNNHVLANQNALPVGAPIFQPGLLDKNAAGADKIGALTHFIKLEVHSPNHVDCAIAELADGIKVSSAVMPRVNKLKSGSPVAAAEEMQVEKTGRTTGYTTGTIHDVSATVKVQYDLGMLTFADQILIGGVGKKSFSEAGDSGALVVDRKSKRPVGLLFGGTDRYTVANHLPDVLTHLGVSIVA